MNKKRKLQARTAPGSCRCCFNSKQQHDSTHKIFWVLSHCSKWVKTAPAAEQLDGCCIGAKNKTTAVFDSKQQLDSSKKIIWLLSSCCKTASSAVFNSKQQLDCTQNLLEKSIKISCFIYFSNFYNKYIILLKYWRQLNIQVMLTGSLRHVRHEHIYIKHVPALSP